MIGGSIGFRIRYRIGSDCNLLENNYVTTNFSRLGNKNATYTMRQNKWGGNLCVNTDTGSMFGHITIPNEFLPSGFFIMV